jgi:hypothetical protein
MRFTISHFAWTTPQNQRWWDFLVKRLNYRTHVTEFKAGPTTDAADLTTTLSPVGPVGVSQRFAIWGRTAANANAKSVRLDQTIGGVTTTGVWNSTSANLNNESFLIRGEILRSSQADLAICVIVETSNTTTFQEMTCQLGSVDSFSIVLLSSPDWTIHGKRIEFLEDS